MALEIRTKPALIGIKRTPGNQSIEQPKAKVEGSISFAKVNIESTLPKVQIDQNQSFNESGLKDNKTFSSDYVNFAKQKMQESMGRIADQGNQLAEIHLGGDPIADQALYNAFDQFYHEFGMVTMPRTRPEITVIEGKIDTKVQEGKIEGKIVPQKPILNYKVGKTEAYLKQMNSISIEYLGERLDLKV